MPMSAYAKEPGVLVVRIPSSHDGSANDEVNLTLHIACSQWFAFADNSLQLILHASLLDGHHSVYSLHGCLDRCWRDRGSILTIDLMTSQHPVSQALHPLFYQCPCSVP